MRSGNNLLIVAQLLVAIIAAHQAFADESSHTIDFIYIDANAGGSSGGHVALKLDDSVYHFQNQSGYNQLVRENWNQFRYIYNDVENRNLFLASLMPHGEAFSKINDHLSLLRITQSRHADYLKALENDQDLLSNVDPNITYPLKRAGFFTQSPSADPTLNKLKLTIEKNLGDSFLKTQQLKLSGEIQNLNYNPQPTGILTLSKDLYPNYPPTFSETLERLYLRWLVMTIIQDQWPINQSILIQEKTSSVEAHLTTKERNWLEQLSAHYSESILKELSSPDTLGSEVLILDLVRYYAITKSLSSGYLFLINTLQNSSTQTQSPLIESQKNAITHRLWQLEIDGGRLRRDLFILNEPSERGLGLLENWASEKESLRNMLRDDLEYHFAEVSKTPEANGMVKIPLPEQRTDALKIARNRASEFKRLFYKTYGYNLLTRNCVTELLNAVNNAFSGPEDQKLGLGGVVDSDDLGAFVPYRAYDLVQTHYPTQRTVQLKARRNRLRSNENVNWLNDPLEFMTFTSSTYKIRSADGAFVFFTDNAFWERPILGALNLTYGLGTAAFGLVIAPFDQMGTMKEGLNGALFSLPELLGWNIRKGSYHELEIRPSRNQSN